VSLIGVRLKGLLRNDVKRRFQAQRPEGAKKEEGSILAARWLEIERSRKSLEKSKRREVRLSYFDRSNNCYFRNTPLKYFPLLCFLVLSSCARDSRSADLDRNAQDSNARASLSRKEEKEGLTPPNVVKLAKGETKAPTSEELNETLKREGANWFYGPGIGSTMLNVGAIVIFPPYALYLVFNIGREMAGYEPLYFTDALPPKAKSSVNGAYKEVVSVPGRVNAAVAREKFRDR